MVFIDLVYSLDQILNEWAERNPKVYILKAVMSIITIASAVIICFLSFNYVPLYVFIINTVCLALFFVVTMLRIFASNSLLVYGLIMLYINAVCFYLETSSE